jgi:leucyl aminopeptidase
MIKIQKSAKLNSTASVLILLEGKDIPEAPGLLAEGREWLQKQKADTFELLPYQQLNRHYYFLRCDSSMDENQANEKIRVRAAELLSILEKAKVKTLGIVNHTSRPSFALAACEGIGLSHYKFDKYLSKKSPFLLSKVQVLDKQVSEKDLGELGKLIESVHFARDLVNEPQNTLTATQLSEACKELGRNTDLKVKVFGKKKLEEMKMGGILSVNMGSMEPPTFTIMEWKPKNAMNKKPIVLVGKGVVYDTGGLSLKPTPNSMDMMKCDMAGSAAVIGTMKAVSENELPVHVVGLVPASDNRPGLNAYAPGDVITMYDGTTVEVLNTDAEGRLLLADALSYAKKYDPDLVLEASTLTGAAVRAVGEIATAVMATDGASSAMTTLKSSGMNTYERVIEFPLWEEYGQELKSQIADLKNLGGPLAGQIHAGKFLEHFTDYPFIHCDIAGPAFIGKQRGYNTAGGTGTGVRLFYDFIKRWNEL